MNSMSPFSSRALLGGLTLALVCLTTSVRAQDAVVDGGFEASPPPSNPMDPLGPGPFSAAWTVVDPSGTQPPGSEGSNSNVGHDPLFAHSGNEHANLGATPNVGTLTQTLTTTPGQTYTLSFWLANDGAAGGGEVNQFDALWNGTPVLTQTNVPVSLYTHTHSPLWLRPPQQLSSSITVTTMTSSGWMMFRRLSPCQSLL